MLGIFKHGVEFVGRTVSIAGEHATGEDLAARLSNVLGEQVTYRPQSYDEARAAGYPGAVEVGNMFEFYSEAAAYFTGARDLELVRRSTPSCSYWTNGWSATAPGSRQRSDLPMGTVTTVPIEVSVSQTAARPTVVIAATTTWHEFPRLWQPMLDEVWACLRAGGITRGCRNVMLYREGLSVGLGLNVEIGVELTVPCPLTGRVVASELPAGRVATTVHIGPYVELGAAHRAVLAWCAANDLRTTGTRWEIYGPHDPAGPWTEISYELA